MSHDLLWRRSRRPHRPTGRTCHGLSGPVMNFEVLIVPPVCGWLEKAGLPSLKCFRTIRCERTAPYCAPVEDLFGAPRGGLNRPCLPATAGKPGKVAVSSCIAGASSVRPGDRFSNKNESNGLNHCPPSGLPAVTHKRQGASRWHLCRSTFMPGCWCLRSVC